MPQFVLVYLGGNEPSTPEEGQRHFSKYMEWLSSLGDSAVSPANPLKKHEYGQLRRFRHRRGHDVDVGLYDHRSRIHGVGAGDCESLSVPGDRRGSRGIGTGADAGHGLNG